MAGAASIATAISPVDKSLKLIIVYLLWFGQVKGVWLSMEMRPTGDRTNATFVHASSTPCEQGMNYHIFHRTTELKTFISESHFAWRGKPLIDKSALNLSNGFVPSIHVSLHRASENVHLRELPAAE
jgi:hypothetical protein